MTAEPPAVDPIAVCASASPAVIMGSTGNDSLRGTSGDDVICGLGGHDVITGSGGRDVLVGGDGNDKIDGGNGDDALFGGAGDDEINDPTGNDIIDGDLGNDRVKDSNGNDRITTGDGNDSVDDSNGDDQIDAGAGDDTVKDANGNDVISLGDGTNDLRDSNGNDVITAGSGNDTVDDRNGNDRVSTGDGNDRILAGNGDDTVDAGGGNDVVESGNGRDFANGGGGDDQLVGGNDADTLISGSGADILVGGNGDDYVEAGSDDDVVDGGQGNDLLVGDDGFDSLTGGQGVDTCVSGESLQGCEGDGRSDLDRDGVDDLIERRFGTSTSRADTDGDGLTDSFEIAMGGIEHWPTTADSDADSVTDGAEDVDGDGASALSEQTAGTDPLNEDTDRDNVGDPAEPSTGTDPLDGDSDDDGLLDGAEPGNGTDPTLFDTDGDGVADGEDEHVVLLAGLDTTVALTGVGDLYGATTIEPAAVEFGGAPGQVTSPIEVTVTAGEGVELHGATITVQYDEGSLPGDETNLSVFTWDEDDLIWLQAGGATPQTVDVDANTVTATVEHFSVFALFDLTQWFSFWAAPPDCSGSGQGAALAVDVALVIDSSGSMSWNDPQGLRRTAAKSFVDLLAPATGERPADRAAVVDFDSFASLYRPLTSDKVLLKAAIDRIDSSGGTNLGAGVSLGLNELARESSPDVQDAIVLLTDGVGSYSTALTAQAASAGVVVFTVGLGSEVDQALLEAIASGTGGRYFPVEQAADLEAVFIEIGGEITEQDGDGDGLDDCDEVAGMKGSAGRIYYSDPHLADTDGDLLPDGIEMGEKLELRIYPPATVPADPFYYPAISDPSDANSDADENPIPPDDGFEYTNGTVLTLVDSDGDGLDDGMEYIENLNPRSRDTDGDGFDDFYEMIGAWEDDAGAAISLDLDPRIADETVDFGEWTRLYVKGFACGDLLDLCPGVNEADTSTVPYIIGSVASGFGGPIADIRDVFGSILHGDLGGIGINLIGLIPLGGDSVQAVGKFVRFVGRIPASAMAAVVRAIDRFPIPRQFRDDLIDVAVGDGLRVLRDSGLTAAGEARLLGSGVDLKSLAKGIAGAAPETFRPIDRFLVTWKDGERILRQEPGFLTKGRGFADPAGGRRNWRIMDAYNPNTRVARESKVGIQRLTDTTRRQIDRDVVLRADPNTPIESIEWHFFASNQSGQIASDPALFDYLTQNGIPYVIHLP